MRGPSHAGVRQNVWSVWDVFGSERREKQTKGCLWWRSGGRVVFESVALVIRVSGHAVGALLLPSSRSESGANLVSLLATDRGPLFKPPTVSV